MQPRPAFLIPVVALLAAAVAGCSSAATSSSAVPTPAGTKTVTLTVTSSPAVPAATTQTATARPLTSTATRASTPTPTTSAPSFAAFTGDWTGHTKFISVSTTGRLEERVGDGCCHPVVDMVIQLSNPHRVGGTWVADGRVFSAKTHDGWDPAQPAPKPGDRTVVKVGADHILRESITGYAFCDPDKTEPGTCGA